MCVIVVCVVSIPSLLFCILLFHDGSSCVYIYHIVLEFVSIHLFCPHSQLFFSCVLIYHRVVPSLYLFLLLCCVCDISGRHMTSTSSCWCDDCMYRIYMDWLFLLQGFACAMQPPFTASCGFVCCFVGVQYHAIIVADIVLNCMVSDAMSLQRECSPCYNRIMCCGCLSMQRSVHSLHCVGSTCSCLFLYATFTKWHASIHSVRHCHPLLCFVIA